MAQTLSASHAELSQQQGLQYSADSQGRQALCKCSRSSQAAHISPQAGCSWHASPGRVARPQLACSSLPGRLWMAEEEGVWR